LPTRARWLIAVLVFGVAGCGVQVALTKRPGFVTQRVKAAKAKPCEGVVVLNERAPHDWKVVGVIDLAAFSGRALPRDDEAFLELVRPAVCEAGGNAVIAGVNGDGRYVMGTVIAWTGSDAAPQTPHADPKPAAAAASADSPLARTVPRSDCLEDPAC